MEIRPVNSAAAMHTASNLAVTPENEIPVHQVVTAVRDINKSELMGQGRQLNFTRDPDTRRPIIQIVDKDTGEVVDQLPAETVLNLARQLK